MGVTPRRRCRLITFGWSGRHPVNRFAIQEDVVDQPTQNSHELGGCFARLLWIAVGNLILVLTAIGIAQNHSGFKLTMMDAVFGITAICLPIVRFIDIRFLNGKTTDNQKATMADWGRYTATVLGVALVLWLAAHLIS
jgi:hypothetical protein